MNSEVLRERILARYELYRADKNLFLASVKFSKRVLKLHSQYRHVTRLLSTESRFLPVCRVNAGFYESVIDGKVGLKLSKLFEVAEATDQISRNRARALVEVGISAGIAKISPSDDDARVKYFVLTELGKGVVEEFIRSELEFVTDLGIGGSDFSFNFNPRSIAGYLNAQVDNYLAIREGGGRPNDGSRLQTKTGYPEMLSKMAIRSNLDGGVVRSINFSISEASKVLSVSGVQVRNMMKHAEEAGIIRIHKFRSPSVTLDDGFFEVFLGLKALEAAIYAEAFSVPCGAGLP